MGINILANSSLGIDFYSIFFFCFPFCFPYIKLNMNLVFAGILLTVTMVTARRASLGEKTMQAAGKSDEPNEAKTGSGLLTPTYCYWKDWPCENGWSYGCKKGRCWSQCKGAWGVEKGVYGEWCWSSIYYKHDIFGNYLGCEKTEDCTLLMAYKRGCASSCSM